MGSFAGIDLAQKLLSAAAMHRVMRSDQDQIPFILWSVPQIPDRGEAAFDPKAADPYPFLSRAVDNLGKAGADLAVLACNTAHHWHARLAQEFSLPIPHIADAAVNAVANLASKRGRIGLLGGYATIQMGMYQSRLIRRGLGCVLPTDEESEDLVMPSIRLAKVSNFEGAGPLLATAVEKLADRGAEFVILACTELPVVLEKAKIRSRIQFIDPNQALAEVCVRWTNHGAASISG